MVSLLLYGWIIACMDNNNNHNNSNCNLLYKQMCRVGTVCLTKEGRTKNNHAIMKHDSGVHNRDCPGHVFFFAKILIEDGICIEKKKCE